MIKVAIIFLRQSETYFSECYKPRNKAPNTSVWVLSVTPRKFVKMCFVNLCIFGHFETWLLTVVKNVIASYDAYLS